MIILTLSHDGRSTTVLVDQNPASCHPKAGTIPAKRFREALRRVGATSIQEVEHDAKELWRYRGGVFVGWEVAA